MDLTSKGDGPPSGLLIDLGDSYNYTATGYKYGDSPPGEAVPSASFNAAEAISAVFGFFDPYDPDLLSPPPDPEAPPLAPSNIFSSVSSGGFGDAAPTSSFGDSLPSSISTSTGFNGAVRSFGGPRPFGDAAPRPKPKHPFVTPLLRTGGFEIFGGSTQFGEGNAQFGGHTPSDGGFHRPRGGAGFRNHRGSSHRHQYNPKPSTGMPWNGGRFDGSGDSGKSAPSTPTDGRFLSVNGFGRTSEDGSLLQNRSRTGKREKESGSRNRNRKRSGRRRGRRSTSEAVATDAKEELPKEANTQPFDFGVKRGVKSFGENAHILGMETPHKRPRMSCGNCGRCGHSTDTCFSARNRESLRCYNCNNLGHLAVRCPQSSGRGAGRGRGHGGSRGGGTRPFGGQPGGAQISERAGGNGAAEGEKNQADATNNGSGLSLICKLMQDAQMRRETQRRTPKLYDEMLTFMLEHVKI